MVNPTAQSNIFIIYIKSGHRITIPTMLPSSPPPFPFLSSPHPSPTIYQQFKSPLRTYMLRMLALSQQSPKFALNNPYEQSDNYFMKLLQQNTNECQQIKQSIIYELTNVEIRSDQHCLLILTLLYQLAKWVIDTVGDIAGICRYSENIPGAGLSILLNCGIEMSVVDCIINQSVSILVKHEKKHQAVITKNNQLVRILLQLIPSYLPVVIAKYCNNTNSNNNNNGNSSSLSNILFHYQQIYCTLLDLTLDIKQSYPAQSKQQMRKNYNRTIQTSLKYFGNLLTLIINQTPTSTSSITIIIPIQSSTIKSPHYQFLIELLNQILKYLTEIHRRQCQGLDRVIAVLNCIALANPINVNTNANNTNVNMGGNSSVVNIPTALVNGIYPELYSIWNGNYNQFILSHLRIQKLILDILSIISNLHLTKILKQSIIHNSLKSSKHTHTITNINSHTQLHDLLTFTNKLEYNQQILHTIAHICIQINGYVRVTNYYVFGLMFGIYQKLLPMLVRRDSMVPLYLYSHFVVNNVRYIMEVNNCKFGLSGNLPSSPSNPLSSISNNLPPLLIIPQLNLHISSLTTNSSSSSSHTTSPFELTILQTLLQQIANIFNKQNLSYFLKLYDWNFMEQNICLNSIKYLYEFVDNCDNQKRLEYQLFRKCNEVINKKIELFLLSNNNNNNGISNSNGNANGNGSETIAQLTKNSQKQKSKTQLNKMKRQRKQFYQLKKKQYQQLVQKINKKPKQIFKQLKQMAANGQHQIRQDFIQKCVRIIKKSNHIEQRAMIDFMAANNNQSMEILDRYIESFFVNRNDKHRKSLTTHLSNQSVEHFLRSIISNFFLAGQAQQVIRFIDQVTKQYYAHQPPTNILFKTSDSLYTFANAIILLNSDLHNPKNPKRMSLQDFIKMCEKINAGQNLPVEIVKQTYKNIKNSEIHTFRNRYNMQEISRQCWLELVNDYDSVGISYYDHQIADICEQEQQNQNQGSSNESFKQFANQILLTIIDQKQMQKLEAMIERFQYDDKKFDCEIIEKIRAMVINKKHIAMHALQKIEQQADFKNKKTDDKIISYCWLATGVIQNYYDALPYSKVAEYLLKSWKVGFELKDNLFIRQNLQLKMIKKCIKQQKKKQSKRSIVDMFSKFLSSKDSEQQSDGFQSLQSPLPNSGSTNRRRANITNSSFNIMKILMQNNGSRARAAETVLLNLRREEARRFEEFTFCIYLIFHFIYGEPPSSIAHQSSPQHNQSLTHTKSSNINQNPISSQCLKMLLNLLQDFFSISQVHPIGTRIDQLKIKSVEKYQLIYQYAQFWSLRCLILWGKWNWVINANRDGDGDGEKKEEVGNMKEGNQQQMIRVEHDETKDEHKKQQKARSIQKIESSHSIGEIQQRISKIYVKCQSLIHKINHELLTQLIEMIDVEELSYDKLSESLLIPAQFAKLLKNATQTHKIKFKYFHVQNSGSSIEKKVVAEEKGAPSLSSSLNLSQTSAVSGSASCQLASSQSKAQLEGVKQAQLWKSGQLHNQNQYQSKQQKQAKQSKKYQYKKQYKQQQKENSKIIEYKNQQEKPKQQQKQQNIEDQIRKQLGIADDQQIQHKNNENSLHENGNNQLLQKEDTEQEDKEKEKEVKSKQHYEVLKNQQKHGNNQKKSEQKQKQEDKPNSVKSNQSNEDLGGYPIYML